MQYQAHSNVLVVEDKAVKELVDDLALMARRMDNMARQASTRRLQTSEAGHRGITTPWRQHRAMAPSVGADATGDGPAVFDRQILAGLPMVADGSQPHYAQVVLDMYFKSLPKLLSDIRQAALCGDTQKVQFTAHSLKSSSAAVGALAMAAYAAQAEAQLRDGNPNMSHIPSGFDMEFERLCATLDRLTT